MKTECSIVRDLLPLYMEDMVCAETAQYVQAHLRECPECRAELDSLRAEENVLTIPDTEAPDTVQPFRKIMKRMNRRMDSLAYLLIVCFIFLGFAWTDGENLMYNSLLMPIVGVFGYYVFRWKAIYKVPLLLLLVELFVCASGLVAINLYAALLWTQVYSIFVYVGMAIAFLLHYTFRKEENP